jgi:predicted MPP superfamily phosphohydrolase
MLLTRRSFFRLLGTTAVTGLAVSSYAVAVEPRLRLIVKHYRLLPPRWPASDQPLRVAVLADIHAVEPWMPRSRIEEIVAVANHLEPDLIVLLGDYVAGVHRQYRTGEVSPAAWGEALARLSAPLGSYAILGNHDWWDDVDAVRAALVGNGIPVFENRAELIRPAAGPAFWLAGLGDQRAFHVSRHEYRGVDDLPGTLSAIPDDGNPILLLAHEPDIFPEVPDRVSLTMCGHTHGGQVVLPYVGPLIVPSDYGDRYAYGHIVEGGRHLIVSGGLGLTWMPFRFGVPPEVLIVEIGGPYTGGDAAI